MFLLPAGSGSRGAGGRLWGGWWAEGRLGGGCQAGGRLASWREAGGLEERGRLTSKIQDTQIHFDFSAITGHCYYKHVPDLA